MQKERKRHTHLANLELANCSNGKKELKIDVLIGQNFYYSFISNTVIRGKSGPVVLRSTLEWILGGGDKSKWESFHLYRYAYAISQVSKRQLV